MARQFVAGEPTSIVAWHALLFSVRRTGNLREAERLARMGLERFPFCEKLRFFLAEALARSGRAEAAVSLLRDALAAKSPMSIDEILLLAELELKRDPGGAGELYAAAADRYPDHALAALGVRGASSMIRSSPQAQAICFLLTSDWHRWIQQPIADALDRLSIPYFFTACPWAVKVHQPGIVVLSDPIPLLMKELRWLVPYASVVNTRHGISVNGKNYGLYSAAACDFVCASSEQNARALAELALLPGERIWTTGYPQMDGLFRRLRSPGAGIRAGGGRTVLFAPTFDPEFSAAFLIGDDPVGTLRGADSTIRVVLAGHPHLKQAAPDLLAAWQMLAATRPNVEFFDTSTRNIIDYLADVDVLVSDVSSVAVQFLALDRPLVRLVDPAKAQTSFAYAPDGTEWKLESVATTVTRPDDLASAVAMALSGVESEELRANRKRLQNDLFGTCTDGGAGERIADRLVQRLASDRVTASD